MQKGWFCCVFGDSVNKALVLLEEGMFLQAMMLFIVDVVFYFCGFVDGMLGHLLDCFVFVIDGRNVEHHLCVVEVGIVLQNVGALVGLLSCSLVEHCGKTSGRLSWIHNGVGLVNWL